MRLCRPEDSGRMTPTGEGCRAATSAPHVGARNETIVHPVWFCSPALRAVTSQRDVSTKWWLC